MAAAITAATAEAKNIQQKKFLLKNFFCEFYDYFSAAVAALAVLDEAGVAAVTAVAVLAEAVVAAVAVLAEAVVAAVAVLAEAVIAADHSSVSSG